MSTIFWISYAVLWMLIIPLVILNMLLFRQLGIMVMGTARGVDNTGLPKGKKIPSVEGITIKGEKWSSDELRDQAHLLFFAAPNCKECAEIIPDVHLVSKDFNVKPIIFLFGDTEQALDYTKRYNLNDFEMVLADAQIGDSFDIGFTPFAYSINSDGIIQDKGLVNNRKHLERIFAAADFKRIA